MLKFPHFTRTRSDEDWVAWQLQTANYILTLWRAASTKQRSDPEFLLVLARCAWVNNPEGSDEARVRWRNAHLARWAGLSEAVSDGELAARLAQRLHLPAHRAKRLVRTDSGITRYYPTFRPAFDTQVRKHAHSVAAACRLASPPRGDSTAKAAAVTRRILAIPEITVPAGGTSSVLNGLSPLLACLDPQRRIPIINARTARLLASFGQRPDADGAASLSRFIGSHGIRHAFDLDVYAQTRHKRFPRACKRPRLKVHGRHVVGIKSEEATVAALTKTKLRIRRRHNALTNRFIRALEGRFIPVESVFDALIEDWRKGRRLLVEAKPSIAGPAGRMQLRLAIGQLYDYRFQHFRQSLEKVDLALLTESKPDAEAIALLGGLGIHALWFERKSLRGTVALVGSSSRV